mmetsp:Transcript_7787/g.13221  ORF Transcript_7787/g.13221 Transcript_7787/m.13221 type:complete len:90 (+) Transcript_7787:99-368(+)
MEHVDVIFIISLERRTDRRAAMDARLSGLGISESIKQKISFLPAIDGSLIDEDYCEEHDCGAWPDWQLPSAWQRHIGGEPFWYRELANL